MRSDNRGSDNRGCTVSGLIQVPSVLTCTVYTSNETARHINGFVLSLELISIVILLEPGIQVVEPMNEMARLYSGLRLISLLITFHMTVDTHMFNIVLSTSVSSLNCHYLLHSRKSLIRA